MRPGASMHAFFGFNGAQGFRPEVSPRPAQGLASHETSLTSRSFSPHQLPAAAHDSRAFIRQIERSDLARHASRKRIPIRPHLTI